MEMAWASETRREEEWDGLAEVRRLDPPSAERLEVGVSRVGYGGGAAEVSGVFEHHCSCESPISTAPVHSICLREQLCPTPVPPG